MPRLAPIIIDFGAQAESYLLACRAENMSPRTIQWYSQKLRAFTGWLAAKERVERVTDVSPEHVRRFLDHLRTSVEPWASNPYVPTNTGGRLSAYTIKGYAQVVKGFYSWLEREGHVERHAITKLRMPKVPKKLVRPLNPEQVASLLSAPDTRMVGGIRDLAVLSLLLDTGIRVSELCGLRLGHIEQRVQSLRVLGKGSKERMVGFGTATNKALTRWLAVRPELLGDRSDEDALFVGQYGSPLTRHAVEESVRAYGERARLERRCYPHLLRHTFAVSFLRAGGNAFALQQLLGHTSLETTKLYVYLAGSDVLDAYRSASPLDQLPRRRIAD